MSHNEREKPPQKSHACKEESGWHIIHFLQLCSCGNIIMGHLQQTLKQGVLMTHVQLLRQLVGVSACVQKAFCPGSRKGNPKIMATPSPICTNYTVLSGKTLDESLKCQGKFWMTA
eukprot:EG_transcript_28832